MIEFSTWLDERYQYDIDARNNKVEQFCLNHFNNLLEINIVDVGSGTGSNFINLSEKFIQNQHWTFLEQDESLISHSLKRIKQKLASRGYIITQQNNKLIFQKSSRRITIQTVNGSLLDIDKLINLTNTNLITASAIFDLFSIEQFKVFSEQVHQEKVSVLSTLNYTSMHFEPSTASDDQFIKLYNAHMKREQSFGTGMGSDCYANMESYYAINNIATITGDSDWNLDNSAKTMHTFLLTFMADSIAELDNVPKNLQQWVKEKRELSAQARLKIIVSHGDTFTFY